MSAGLAPDFAVRHRDLLLDAEAMAPRLGAPARAPRGAGRRRLPRGSREVPARREPARPLRARHRRPPRARRAANVHRRAQRAGLQARGRAGHGPRAAARGGPRPRARRGALHLPQRPQARGAAAPARAPGAGVVASRLVAWAPEKCATVRRVDAEGRTLAYAKAYAGDEGARTRRVHDVAARPGRRRRPAAAVGALLRPRAPRCSSARRSTDGRWPRSRDPSSRLGCAGSEPRSRDLHRLEAPPLTPPFERLDADRAAARRSADRGPAPGLRRRRPRARRPPGRRARRRPPRPSACMATSTPRTSWSATRGWRWSTSTRSRSARRPPTLGGIARRPSLPPADRRALRRGRGRARAGRCWTATRPPAGGSTPRTCAGTSPRPCSPSAPCARSPGFARGARAPLGPAGRGRRHAGLRRGGGRVSRLPPLLLYCQHSLGLGHLARSLALCAALCGALRGHPAQRRHDAARAPLPAGVRVVSLPPLGMGADGALVADDGRAAGRAHAASCEPGGSSPPSMRSGPRAMVIELFPFGRKKFAAELLPLLERARDARGARPLVACSLRDILVSRGERQRRHDERAAATANRWFDLVLVHSDPDFARLEDSFDPRSTAARAGSSHGLRRPAANRRARRTAAHRPRAVVSAGGGRVGEPLLRGRDRRPRAARGTAADAPDRRAPVPRRPLAGARAPRRGQPRARARALGPGPRRRAPRGAAPR